MIRFALYYRNGHLLCCTAVDLECVGRSHDDCMLHIGNLATLVEGYNDAPLLDKQANKFYVADDCR